MKSSITARKAQPGPDTGRRQSIRQARSTASRPANYYARPFPSFGGPAEETPKDAAPGFFPAIQHFTDSVDALPKEVVRHFSMLKEVEAKVHGPDEMLGQLHKTIFDLPTPLRRHPQPLAQNLLSFTANNSVNGSVNGSVVNGSGSSQPQHAAEMLANSAPTSAVEDEADLKRRQVFLQLRQTLFEMIMILDEKNAVITTANQTLSKQLARMDSSYPSVEGEISEEARLGSLTHWAYHDKDSRRANGATTERRGRDVAATNSLAAAAAAVHDGDIAAHRSELRRQAIAERRTRAIVDSDFDDRPAKKSHHGKARKGADMTGDAKNTNLGANGTGAAPTTKRRKVDRGGGAAAERSMAAAFRAAGTGNSPRATPVAEVPRKKTKAAPSAPGIRKRMAAGGNQSPSVASSPLHSTFAAAAVKEYSPAPDRPVSSRARQGSTSKLTQTATLAETSRNGSTSSTSNKQANGVGTGTPELRAVADVTGRTIAEARSGVKDSYENKEGEHTIEESNIHGALVITDDLPSTNASLKREDAASSAPAATTAATAIATVPDPGPALEADAEPSAPAPVITRSGRQSKTATPITANFPDVPMARSRSTRNNNKDPSGASSANSNGTNASTTADAAGTGGPPAAPKRSHKRGASTAQLQQSSSLDHSRTTSKPSSPDPGRVPLSRRLSRTVPESEGLGGGGGGGNERAKVADEEEDEDAEEGEEEGVDGEDEERYCYCNGVSYGEMVACDNDSCPKEWFHLTCVGLSKPPSSKSEFFSSLFLFSFPFANPVIPIAGEGY
ncbi:MAG: hypothetical protein M1822_002865 [Bathelium mastoideum]|nr:MAG: hypothetical protein M1822_002865 [Bathelium mastoideum]